MAQTPEPIDIPTNDLDLEALWRQAEARHESMKENPGAYQHNSPEGQAVGLLGEKALALWLSQHHPDTVEVGDNPTGRMHGRGDVAIVRRKQFAHLEARQEIDFEVKTNRASDWKRYERTLDAKQHARSNARAFVWCVVADTWPGASVRMMGWLPTPEVQDPSSWEATIEHYRAHVLITRPMRDMRTLPAWWESVPTLWA